ncbi:MAG: carbamoyltransferase HypF [Flavobacteriaceae bacterium]
MQKTYKILISGQVQGVGFRPYVYTLAAEFSLNGTVSNNEEGVIIHITGEEANINSFYDKLLHYPPPVSKIKNSSITEIEFIDFKQFNIIPSAKEGNINLPLTPDFAICDDCKKDIINSANRRFNYPFTTCVNCGPRWSVTQHFPFERENTSIEEYKMCNECQHEYTNPSDRRFHSQTNTCNTCGIDIYLIDNKGNRIELKNKNIFEYTANLLHEGKIIAIKNTSGYLLCCNAENTETVKELRLRKNRPNKPFAVLYPSMEFLQNELEISQKHINSLTSTERPITIIPLKNYKGNIALNVVAPKLNQLGVMLPYTGILQLLANQLNFPIVATSGNIHGSPIISSENEALEKLSLIADYFLQHDLHIEHPQDDSVVKFSNKFHKEVVFRRSRGYAPNYFDVEINSDEKIMALGAHLKSSISFYPNQFVYVSQYLGNLDNYDVYKRFVTTATSFIDIFEQQPQVILIDKHPIYESSKYGIELAEKTNAKLVEIQHHKAHFTAILGEHNLFNEHVLGIILDGTGLGDDGQIWGGEFFDYHHNTITRIHHVEYFDWLLGDKMSNEPRISLLALSTENMRAVLEQKFTESELKTYKTLLKKNKLKTSSVGRLFDAVASLLNITYYNSYEGEAAILLENRLKDYDFKNCTNYISNPEKKLSAKEIIANIYADLQHNVSTEQIITNFLFTLANSIFSVAKKHNYKHIAFSGGVFQNTTLVDMLLELAPKNYKLHFHKSLSPNDENISFGQLLYYTNIKD